jgi:hypothetical protein
MLLQDNHFPSRIQQQIDATLDVEARYGNQIAEWQWIPHLPPLRSANSLREWILAHSR